MDLKTLKDIPTSFSLAKKAIFFSSVVAIFSLFFAGWTYYVASTTANKAYIITESGQLALANSITQGEFSNFREPEIKNHIKLFHEAFWNIDQFSMESNISRALNLIGNSGRQLYLSMKAQGHYLKITNQNLVQSISSDSILIDTRREPYKCAYFGKLKIKRTDQLKEQIENFSAYFDMHNVSRTDLNPHGLLIENYDAKVSPIPIR